MERTESIKYWTIKCQNMEDGEFDDFVSDLERFISKRNVDYVLPQNNSEVWLSKFIESYATWKDRKFTKNKFPLTSYFEITDRFSYRS